MFRSDIGPSCCERASPNRPLQRTGARDARTPPLSAGVRHTKDVAMGQRLDRFFAGSPKPLRLAFLGFVVAGVGAALGFSIDYGPGNPLAYVALGTVVLGVVIGFIAIGWGGYDFFRLLGRRGGRGGV